ncbi:MAG: AmmeMemoRadiSam system radical SAM enzyme [Candidatus Gastranaerophilaceae bacterium]|nr:AmmeMemoRadiSam system radical SAM enzyme [Candidatus Gastranaerophilaceae bacterium]
MEYQNLLTNGKVQCMLCPRKCILRDGQSGFCHVRKNIDGQIILQTYGYNTGLAIDPIEKKPLYQFYPTSGILSFGTLGCNMGCRFCQNWQTTKNRSDCTQGNKTTPREIVQIAKNYNCKSVAFTYNEPVIFFEYALDTAKLCRQNGIKTVAVTSGFINPEPAKEFFNLMDAANIDLKGFSEKFYKKNCLAKLQPVLDTIKYACNETDCHVELTTLLIEGENDSKENLQAECEWIINNVGDCIPLHFSAFFPNYRMRQKNSTKFETLIKAYNIAHSAGLKYVYTGNLTNTETSSTYCKNCGQAIIIRNGYKLLQYNLTKGGNCTFCGTKCDGRFE